MIPEIKAEEIRFFLQGKVKALLPFVNSQGQGFLFDQYVRKQLPVVESQIVGFRYFNVYGPREQHKGDMASLAAQLNRQLLEQDQVRLFEGSHGYAAGEQRRDFVFVDDAVDVNLWFLDHPEHSGVFNLGTGRSQTFNGISYSRDSVNTRPPPYIAADEA